MISSRLLNRIESITHNLAHLPQGRHKHFSFIVRRNTIISVGWNKSFQTHPIAKRFGHRFHCIHSELDVILNFPYRLVELDKFQFINVRLGIDHFSMAKPCTHCTKMLSYYNIHRIIYSNYDGGFYEFRTIT